jgi:hypothetical protein
MKGKPQNIAYIIGKPKYLRIKKVAITPTYKRFSILKNFCDILFPAGCRCQPMPSRFNQDAFRIYFGYRFLIQIFDALDTFIM